MFMQKLNLSSVSSQCIGFKPSINLSSPIFCRLKTSYIVLLPEVPDDTAETNSLLNDNEYPDFKDLNSEKCYSGVGRRCLDYETGVWQIEESIKDGSQPNTFTNIISGLDKLDAPLTYAWSISKNLFTVRNDEISTSSYLKIHERARKARVYKFQSRPIYEACKEIYVKETSLNEAQKRVVRKYLLEARLNGVELPVKANEALSEALQKLEKHKSLYRKKLQESSKRFSYRIIDHDIVRDFPESLLKNMSYSSADYLKGPWTVTHHPLVYQKFMEHCPHKDLRWNAWKAYIMRSSVHLDPQLSNGIHVEEIRGARQEQAKCLGFKNFADMSMETKMAGSVDNVLTTITSLFVKAKAKQEEEMEALQGFAEERGFQSQMEECDVAFWRRRQLAHISNNTEMKIDEYFPFDHVWEQVLSLCSNLFGVRFEQATGAAQTWDSHVRLYHVIDEGGTKVASFYLDPFKRPGQKLYNQANSAWMLPLKTRCDVANNLPLATLIFNFPTPSSENNNTSLLSFEDLQTLLKKFGHALQHLLSTVPYGQASGLTNIEWDAVEVSSNFLLNWLYEPTVLEKLSKHYESGLPLDKVKIHSILAGRSHMAAHDLCKQLFLSHLDIKLHSEDAFWLDIMKELWPNYMPFELSKHNFLPCWFSPVISEVWAAAYYSHVWSMMLAADAFRAFKECESHEVPAVGKRFRETFLSLGGGCHPAQVFRQFRGRDPMPEALHKVLGIC